MYSKDYPQISTRTNRYVRYETQWYPTTTPPSKVGYYKWEQSNFISSYFWYWDGKNWYYDSSKQDKIDPSPNTFWQGLTKEF